LPLLTSDFDYDLPEDLIAQTPAEPRDSSRLLVVHGENVEHKQFSDLPHLLRPGDLLVLNNTRVIPARLVGIKSSGGAVELLLLKRLNERDWETLARPSKRLKVGDEVNIGGGTLIAEVLENLGDGLKRMRFRHTENFESILYRLGQTPLPPYIKMILDDPERYQTVYSRVDGSIAAPTAGLHFTDELLDALRAKGIETTMVTLHVGLGTFRPVVADNLDGHKMHEEWFEITEFAAKAIQMAKKNNRRIVAVGTTVCRTLESSALENGQVTAGSGETSLFITPGFEFKAVDAIITNFHLPKTTLLMLVSAFSGRENILHAYQAAIEEEYRFYSFGDACLLEK
jgi:S-adenosylmethionine:tRNA ribosyltransferase-isomerase